MARRHEVTAPAAAKKPGDHRPAKAAAKAEGVGFTFGERHYFIPAERTDNVELFELLEDDKALTALRAFLGADQWAAFKDSVREPDGRVPMKPAEEMLNALMEAIGGNSSASPSS